MYGDYEAQRHWMEISVNLPPSQWYQNTTENDLAYWGLDYPPLSAFVSYAFGSLIAFVEPEAVALRSSRGYESELSRVLMRCTVLLCDILIFFPALYLLLSHFLSPDHDHNHHRSIFPLLAFCLTLPAPILIDHAHFQYNNVSLGFFLLASLCFINSYDVFGATLFCAAIYFKHMTLYYAPAIFAFLFARLVQFAISKKFAQGGALIAKVFFGIFLATLVSFAPWLSSLPHLLQIVNRLFPLSRGLYEGKVANVWCSMSVLVKLNQILPERALFSFCAAITLLASLPFCVAVMLKPTKHRLLLSCAGCALSAFLFSYQVHEKQILIPLMPFAILYNAYPFLATWMSFASAVSLLPLLYVEQSVLAYVGTLMVHLAVVMLLSGDDVFGEFPGKGSNSRPLGGSSDASTQEVKEEPWRRLRGLVYLRDLFAIGSGIIAIALNMALVFATPPTWAPDLFVLLTTIYSCAHFCLIYMVSIFAVFTC